MTHEQQLENWINEFQKLLMKLFEETKKAYEKAGANDLFYGGKFATMKEVQRLIDTRPVPKEQNKHPATIELETWTEFNKAEESEEDLSQFL